MVFDVSTDTLSLYLNGSVAVSANGIGSLHNHGLSAIGASRDWVRFHDGAAQNGGHFFAGTIDEVAVYPFALQPVTVNDHYAFRAR